MFSTRFRAFLLCIIASFTPSIYPVYNDFITGMGMGVIGGGVFGIGMGWHWCEKSQASKTEKLKQQEIAKTEEAKRREMAYIAQTLQSQETERKHVRTLLATIQHELSHIPDACLTEQILRFSRSQKNIQWPVLSLFESMQSYKNKLSAIDPRFLDQAENDLHKKHLHKIEMILGKLGNEARDILQQDYQHRANYEHIQKMNQEKVENLRRDGKLQQKHLAHLEKLEVALERNQTLTQQQSAQLAAQGMVIDRIVHENRRAHENLSNQIGITIRSNVQEGIRQEIKQECNNAVHNIQQSITGNSTSIKKKIQEQGEENQRTTKETAENLWTRMRSSTPVASSGPAIPTSMTPANTSSTHTQNTPNSTPPASTPAT